MKVVSFENVSDLGISPERCVDWVMQAFILKYDSILPAKISIKDSGSVFYNTMPCLLPYLKRFGLKEVTRFPNRNPALSGDILLYNSSNGELLALMDATWITSMRTGAVASVAIEFLRSSLAKSYGFIGLGNTARATLICLLSTHRNEFFEVKLLSYKTHTDLFIERFKEFNNVRFEVVNSVEELALDTDVIVSCITATDNILIQDYLFKEGVLVVPIHTRGFQNCDLFFDKVIVDDISHVKGFKYFNNFKSIEELSKIINGDSIGRSSVSERILSYNIGIALHDIYFASMIYEMTCDHKDIQECTLSSNRSKFWV